MEKLPATKSKGSSVFQLLLFTGFLFLLVAIPYTIYLKSSQQPKAVAPLTVLPSATKPSPIPSITPPPASTTTACIPVPQSYPAPVGTPSAYFFQDTTYQLCYPPSLPPFPFVWQPYIDFHYHYSIDIPSNWVNKTTTIQGTRVNIFTSEETASADAKPTVSFAWYEGVDPYSTVSGYLKQSVILSGKNGTVYTHGSNFIAAVFSFETGYLLLQASRMDSALYAFQHMLLSLRFQ